MFFRSLSLYLFIFTIFYSSIESSPLSDDFLLENDSSSSSNLGNTPSVLIHSSNFISLICQQQEQYPLKLTRKLCSNYFPSYKIQEEQQRGKRVGWTISV